MSHKITLGSLLIGYKRSIEGAAIANSDNLSSCLIAYSIAYSAPLPNCGEAGYTEAYNAVVVPYVNSIISDANELVHLRIKSVLELSQLLYKNRYLQAWSPKNAFYCPSVEQIMKELMHEDECWERFHLWIERFYGAVSFYIQELKEKGEK